MELEKDSLDFGMFTNNPDAMHQFYSGELGLKFEGTVAMGPKFKLSRYMLNGSVLKLWHAADPLPPRAAGGFKVLTIAESKTSAPRIVRDPDGNQLQFVPPGHNRVDQIEFQMGVSDLKQSERFYAEVMGAQPMGDGRCRLGRTILTLSADPAARQIKTEAVTNPLDAVSAMAGAGIRYLTLQVRDCAAEYQHLDGKPYNPGVAFTSGAGNLAGLFMIRDPDGNWMEVLQRK
jgi:catechol 2,3-dioxygenase-like lactoylglutathione lyase family enzyme